MGPKELSESLKSLIPTGRPVYLWAAPGVGKSSIVKQTAQELGVDLVDVRATLLDPVDLRGLPRVEGDKAIWCPPAFLPRAGKGILFLDELAQAPPLVQAGCLQLTLDRRIGEYELPEGWSVVAASNRTEDRAGTHRLISPLLNRFIHLDLEVSAQDWDAWAISDGIAPEVRSFIRYRPHLLMQFDVSANPRAFPTPRSWSFVSNVLAATPKHLVQRIAAGCVGEGPAAEFYSFLELYQQLPDIDKIFSNPSGTAIPKEPSVIYALVGALVERIRQDKSKAHAFCTYCARLPDEFSVLAMSDALAVNRALCSNSTVVAWISQARKKGLFPDNILAS